MAAGYVILNQFDVERGRAVTFREAVGIANTLRREAREAGIVMTYRIVPAKVAKRTPIGGRS